MSEADLMRRFTLALFAALWLGCIYGLIVSIHSTRQFLDAANRAPGVVVSLNAGGSHPEIEFKNRKGVRISYPQGGLIAGYSVGDRVTVLYLENSPNPQATVDRIGAVWELSIFFGFFVIFIPSIEMLNVLTKKIGRREKAEKWKIAE